MKKPRVLLVDSMFKVRSKLFEQLSSDYDVEQAANGREGMEIFTTSKEPFDIILTGYQMPGMGGIALVKRVRQVNKDIPVVLICAKLPDELGQKLIRKDFGITAFCKRNEDSEILQALIKRLLKDSFEGVIE